MKHWQYPPKFKHKSLIYQSIQSSNEKQYIDIAAVVQTSTTGGQARHRYNACIVGFHISAVIVCRRRRRRRRGRPCPRPTYTLTTRSTTFLSLTTIRWDCIFIFPSLSTAQANLKNLIWILKIKTYLTGIRKLAINLVLGRLSTSLHEGRVIEQTTP